MQTIRGSELTSFVLDGRPFDRAEAELGGLRQQDVTDLLAAGLLRQTVRGVYIDARVPDDLTTRAACLKLRLPPGRSSGG